MMVTPVTVYCRLMLPFHSPATVLAALCCAALSPAVADTHDEAEFENDILPILEDHCYQCHGEGVEKGSVSFDTFESTSVLMRETDLWLHALKNIRSGMMPPAKKKRMPADDFAQLENWIKRGALKLDPEHPDPGRVTLRRLNRVEYRNTIRDLMGVDFRTDEEFPADDTGYGFDTIGDVLSTSSMLLEKYMQAAETIIAKASPLKARHFPRPDMPAGEAGRLQYTREILRKFTTRAFRRPADDATIDKLAAFAAESAAMQGGSFEKGIARAMTAIIASPRFLFRIEETLPEIEPDAHPLLDEWALASRLSYFLWSTMPDDALYKLAAQGELRKNLRAQIERMIQSPKSDALVSNFAGQWLQTRDVEGISINARIIVARDKGGKNAHGQNAEFPGSLRHAMRREAELLFTHLLRTDGSVLGLIDNDSTFLNEELAKHYGVDGVKGREMRLVKLPADSPRGGILTMGAVLAVTSNPTRTSPVKRGVFILDNILGTPPPPPPPDIPSLEASEKDNNGSKRSLRDALALHRENKLCASCHNRMDPLGLALENFNAMGRWRDAELGEPLAPPSGKLITGESFADVNELKRVLVTARRIDYYRCLSEKLLTYALGRGPEACDITTIDALVENLLETDGRFSTLITGIIESPPFQQRQRNSP